MGFVHFDQEGARAGHSRGHVHVLVWSLEPIEIKLLSRPYQKLEAIIELQSSRAGVLIELFTIYQDVLVLVEQFFYGLLKYGMR